MIGREFVACGLWCIVVTHVSKFKQSITCANICKPKMQLKEMQTDEITFGQMCRVSWKMKMSYFGIIWLI